MSSETGSATNLESAIDLYLLQPSPPVTTQQPYLEGEDLNLIPAEFPKKVLDYDASQNQSQEQQATILSAKTLLRHDSVRYQWETVLASEEQLGNQTVLNAQQHPLADQYLVDIQFGEQYIGSTTQNYHPQPVTNEAIFSSGLQYIEPEGDEFQQLDSREKKGIEEYRQEVKMLGAQLKKATGLERTAIKAKITRKKNTIACIVYRQKQKELTKTNQQRIKELEQQLKVLKEESLKNSQISKSQFGMILQTLLQASPDHVSLQAKEYIISEWSKINPWNNIQT